MSIVNLLCATKKIVNTIKFIHIFSSNNVYPHSFFTLAQSLFLLRKQFYEEPAY